jgi:hypothetical protein
MAKPDLTILMPKFGATDLDAIGHRSMAKNYARVKILSIGKQYYSGFLFAINKLIIPVPFSMTPSL